MRMYMLIKARLACKYELETVYTLDEALERYARDRIEKDIEVGLQAELKAKNGS